MLQRVFFLKSLPIFQTIPGNILAAIAPFFEELTVDASQTIFRKGEIGMTMYVIVYGKIRLQDKGKTIGICGKGEIIGMLTALSPFARQMTAIAEEETQLLCLDQDIFYELMSENVEIARDLIQVLVKLHKR